MSKFKKGDKVRCELYPDEIFIYNGRHLNGLARLEFTSSNRTLYTSHSWLQLVDGMVVVTTEANQDEYTGKIKSDGGSSNYYKLTITNKQGESIEAETGDVIRCMVGNDFNFGNCVKALRRMYLCTIGSGKEGIDLKYDSNKVKYFLDEIVSNYELESKNNSD